MPEGPKVTLAPAVREALHSRYHLKAVFAALYSFLY
jgi:hypothetical protein